MKISREEGPCSLNVVNAASPLRFADDQSGAIILLAERNQPVIVTNMMMLGATGPVSVAGALALGNAEILAGIVLAQLVRPGVPVVYGTTSCPMDMRSMVAVLGTPETIWLSRGALGLAAYYGLPCRTGGSLSDSHLPDAQGLLDGGLIFQNAFFNGADFMMHSFGMISSYMAASFEKFVIDEEMVAICEAVLRKPTVSDEEIDVKLLKKLGSRGDYLTQPSTIRKFRNLYRPRFLNRNGHEAWAKEGRLGTSELAAREVKRRLESWQKPDIEPGLEAELGRFFLSRKRQLAAG
jgi:trimethylamine--corrinoid protein Co-methyltransferase